MVKQLTVDEAKLSEVAEVRNAIAEYASKCDQLEKRIAAKRAALREDTKELDEVKTAGAELLKRQEQAMKGLPSSIVALMAPTEPPKASTTERVTHDTKIEWAVRWIEKQEGKKSVIGAFNKAYQEHFGTPSATFIGHIKKEPAKFKITGKGREQVVTYVGE